MNALHFVVFNLTRFARDKYEHFALREHLKSLGISLRSATEPIDDTSTRKQMDVSRRVRAVRRSSPLRPDGVSVSRQRDSLFEVPLRESSARP